MLFERICFNPHARLECNSMYGLKLYFVKECVKSLDLVFISVSIYLLFYGYVSSLRRFYLVYYLQLS